MVQETLKRDPMCGHLFVFRGRGGGLIKVIWHDGQGACLFTKKLERGRFHMAVGGRWSGGDYSWATRLFARRYRRKHPGNWKPTPARTHWPP
ncbi:IS66 family insertion sequence element accessory protein TnpB [Rhizobium sp. SEMIA4064]|uniref:IS66 family insertion sequence element accessory protein TnpB n=2 Tax=Rhizobium TaxID=379 RepID=UPI0032AEF13A